MKPARFTATLLVSGVAAGMFLSLAFNAAAATAHYVDINSTNPVPPFADWSTAATNIQDAVDLAVAGDSIVVTNGIYATGGRAVYGAMTNRLAVTKAVAVQSVNGAVVTIIQGWQIPGLTNGDGALRCAYLTNGASLSGFTLTTGATRKAGNYISEQSGGGIWCESTNAAVLNCIISLNTCYTNGGGVYSGTLSNCALTGNSAANGGGAYRSVLDNCTLSGNAARGGNGTGGGADFSTLNNCMVISNTCGLVGGGIDEGTGNNCVFIGNYAGTGGGGAFHPILNNCTLTGNSSATRGGGVSLGEVTNCISYYNTSPNGGNWDESTVLSWCCTVPRPAGPGNMTNEPLFINLAGGNLRLQSNSPCINSGNNANAPVRPDLDGNPRIVGGTMDMGAYEFQFPTSAISYAWLQQYGFPTDGTADSADPDDDGMNNYKEWICGTNPTNALSVLMMLAPSNSVSGIAVPWQSVSGIKYYMQRSTNLGLQPAFTSVKSNLVGQAGVTAFTDTNAIGQGPFFYRVGVQQ